MKRNFAFHTLLAFLAAPMAPLLLSAQQTTSANQPQHPPRYSFVDLGTLGGPASYGSASGWGSVNLNNRDEVGAYADINVPDPNAPACFNNDCFLSQTFRWKNGNVVALGANGANPNAAVGINSQGWIAGFSHIDATDPITGFPEARAVLWKNHAPIPIGTFGGNESIAIYLNDSGQVTGIADTDVDDPFSLFGTGKQDHTFLYEDGHMRDIGTLGGPDSVPSAICENSRRDFITGQSYTSFIPNPTTGVPEIAPFLWDRGVMTNLGGFGGTFGFGQCANNRGQVIGGSNLAGDQEQHAFLWENGKMHDLGTLGGTYSQASWLTRSGIVLGGATTANDEFIHATLWKNGAVTDLGTLPDYDCSFALARNSKRQVIGQAFDCVTGLQHATLWEDGGAAIDLNSLLPSDADLILVEAFNINDRGVILGAGVPLGTPPTGDAPDLVGHLYLLIPCSNPDSRFGRGCEKSEVAQISSSALSSTRRVHKGLTPESFAALRSRLAPSHHTPGTTKSGSLH
jgi:probable HAF family extracellular repeat protein